MKHAKSRPSSCIAYAIALTLIGSTVWLSYKKHDQTEARSAPSEFPTAFPSSAVEDSPMVPHLISPDQTSSSTRVAESTSPSPATVPDNDPANLPQEVADFRRWARAYLAAPADQRGSMLAEGKELAKRHTATIRAMIPLDPEQAIAHAVPMVIRQDLPDSIVSLLENRVNMRASLDVIGHVPLPGQENSPDFKPYTRMVSTEDGDNWNAYVYGKRGQQHSLSSTSINGISVGYDMAVADSPLRRLENGERPIDDGRAIVESCPVSGEVTTVERTESGSLPACQLP